MKRKIHPGQMVLAISIWLMAVFSLVVLFFWTGTIQNDQPLSDERADIVHRAVDLVGDSSEQAPAVWLRELEAGHFYLADVLRACYTSTPYLLQQKDDAAFAEDLSMALYGDRSAAPAIESMTVDASRVYAIYDFSEKAYPGASPTLYTTFDKVGTVWHDFSLDYGIGDDEGYAFGLQKVQGQLRLSGDAARADFYVNGRIRPSNLMFESPDKDEHVFTMIWDARCEAPGLHKVAVMLRTSDGRGRLISGGTVEVPLMFSLQQDAVQKGMIERDKTDAWYVLDAMDQDAYINFVGLTGDVRLTLYDQFAHLIGENMLPGSDVLALRGKKQTHPDEIADICTAISDNLFYVRATRMQDDATDEPLDYYMVQTKQVAQSPAGSWLSVIDETGPVPTRYDAPVGSDELTLVACRDLSGNEIVYDINDLDFLPINAFLYKFVLLDETTGEMIDVYPDFEPRSDAYAYVSPERLTELSWVILPYEGDAASWSVELYNEQLNDRRTTTAMSTPVASGRNRITVEVTSFDGDTNSYTIYLLNESDHKGFLASTLQTFPASYHNGLYLLHSMRPQYQFEAYPTGLTFAEVLNGQDRGSTSLMSDRSHPNWVKPESPIYDGEVWRAAKREVVAYFLDPRNFFHPVHIFQFEKLAFDPSIHTIDGVRAMVEDSFLDRRDPDYAWMLLQAGEEAFVSPYFLASRIIQEMGRQAASPLATGTLKGYEGYYNFYNIGAYPDPSVPDGARINGAKYAMWGSNPKEQTITPEDQAMLIPWRTPDRAIRGGARWIAGRYINIGQNTLYFQKFDVIDNEDGLYLHQYAQNIAMPYAEGARYFDVYRSQEMLDFPFVFIIPIYEDMPDDFGDLLPPR